MLGGQGLGESTLDDAQLANFLKVEPDGLKCDQACVQGKCIGARYDECTECPEGKKLWGVENITSGMVM